MDAMNVMNVIDILTVTIVIVAVLFLISKTVSSRPQREIPPTFSQLEWQQYASEKDYGTGLMEYRKSDIWLPWGKCAQMHFNNGFGLSVVRHHGSYGGSKGLYEAAVLRKKTQEEHDQDVANGRGSYWYKLTMDTEVMPVDVAGWLYERDVTEYLQRVWKMNEDGTEPMPYKGDLL